MSTKNKTENTFSRKRFDYNLMTTKAGLSEKKSRLKTSSNVLL